MVEVILTSSLRYIYKYGAVEIRKIVNTKKISLFVTIFFIHRLNMKRLFILLFLFAQTALNGQSGYGVNERVLQTFQLDVNLRSNLNITNDYSNINGSPFMQEIFILGNVQTNKDFFKNVNMKYNIVEDAFLFEINNTQQYLEATNYH